MSFSASSITLPVIDATAARKWGWITAAVLAGVYALLLNPYWVPGGDSDFYVAAARTIVRTGNFEYNGLPISISPPGWPWVMARVMNVWPTFLALKLTALGSMLGGIVLAYRVCLRYAPPKTSALACVLAGTLLPVYSLTYFLHSEGLFCLLGSLALLHAVRIREKRAGVWEYASLVLLCVALPFVRWAGIFQTLLVVGILMSRTDLRFDRPRAVRLGLGLACVGLAFLTTVKIRDALELTPKQRAEVKLAGNVGLDQPESAETTETEPVLATLPTTGPIAGAPETDTVALITLSSTDRLSAFEEYGQRFLRAGKWVSWLLWYPTRFANVSKPLDAAVTVIGWFALTFFFTTTIALLRRGDWLFAALAVHCGALVMGWPNPNARYLVPIAPLLVLGVMLGVPTLINVKWPWRKRRGGLGFPIDERQSTDAPRLAVVAPARGARLLGGAFVGSLVICNVASLANDVPVMRSGGDRFYARFEAGQHEGLVNLCHYLSIQRLDRGDVIVSTRYENLNRTRHIPTAPREVALLIDEVIRVLPENLSKSNMPTPQIRNWMRTERGNYFVYQDASIPWRVWHFRVPFWLQQKLSKQPVTMPIEPRGWHLYELRGRALYEVEVPKVTGWPTRVPGL